jgi:enamine deaminase RidA (YjgF/YER057c/UK114 family)
VAIRDIVASDRPPGKRRPAEDADMRKLFSSGSPFEEAIGYSRAVRDGDWVFVSGCTGFDYATMTIPPGAPEQADQAFRNIAAALHQAGAAIADIVRVRYILADRDDFEPCWPVIRGWLGEARPAATMIVAGLLDPRMRIEIEVTARLGTSVP